MKIRDKNPGDVDGGVLDNSQNTNSTDVTRVVVGSTIPTYAGVIIHEITPVISPGVTVTIRGINLDIFDGAVFEFVKSRGTQYRAKIFTKANGNKGIITFLVSDFNDFLEDGDKVELSLLEAGTPRVKVWPYLSYLTKDEQEEADEQKAKDAQKNAEQAQRDGSGGGGADPTGFILNTTGEVLGGIAKPFIPKSLLKATNRQGLNNAIAKDDKQSLNKAIAEAKNLGDLKGLKTALQNAKSDEHRKLIQEAIGTFKQEDLAPEKYVASTTTKSAQVVSETGYGGGDSETATEVEATSSEQVSSTATAFGQVASQESTTASANVSQTGTVSAQVSASGEAPSGQSAQGAVSSQSAAAGKQQASTVSTSSLSSTAGSSQTEVSGASQAASNISSGGIPAQTASTVQESGEVSETSDSPHRRPVAPQSTNSSSATATIGLKSQGIVNDSSALPPKDQQQVDSKSEPSAGKTAVGVKSEGLDNGSVDGVSQEAKKLSLKTKVAQTTPTSNRNQTGVESVLGKQKTDSLNQAQPNLGKNNAGIVSGAEANSEIKKEDELKIAPPKGFDEISSRLKDSQRQFGAPNQNSKPLGGVSRNLGIDGNLGRQSEAGAQEESVDVGRGSEASDKTQKPIDSATQPQPDNNNNIDSDLPAENKQPDKQDEDSMPERQRPEENAPAQDREGSPDKEDNEQDKDKDKDKDQAAENKAEEADSENKAAQPPPLPASDAEIAVIVTEVNLIVNEFLLSGAVAAWTSIIGIPIGAIIGDALWIGRPLLNRIIIKRLQPFLKTDALKKEAKKIVEQIKLNLGVKANIILLNFVTILAAGVLFVGVVVTIKVLCSPAKIIEGLPSVSTIQDVCNAVNKIPGDLSAYKGQVGK